MYSKFTDSNKLLTRVLINPFARFSYLIWQIDIFWDFKADKNIFNKNKPLFRFIKKDLPVTIISKDKLTSLDRQS